MLVYICLVYAAFIPNNKGRIAMLKRITTFLILGMLAGCGGSSDSGSAGTSGDDSNGNSVTPPIDLTGSFKYFGYFDLTDDPLLDRVNRDSNYLELTATQDASVFANSVPPSADSCRLRITSSIPTDVGVIGFPNAQFNFVSAGENFTLTSDAGTYATVAYSEDRFEIAPYPAPAQLVLDIPGDVFPAFSNVVIPEVARAANFKPARNEVLTADTTVTWDPTGIAGNTIYLSVFDFPAAGKVVDLFCSMTDDGEFELPADVQAVLNSSLGVGAELNGAKQNLRSIATIVQGDALLVVTRIIDTL